MPEDRDFRLVDKYGRIAIIDAVSRALAAITTEHSHIHMGERFVVQEGIQLNNASKEYLITTPDTDKLAHMTIDIEGSQDTLIRFYEDTEKTGGVSIQEIDRNRPTANTAGIVVTHTPSGSEGTSGTTIFTCQFGNAALSGGRGGGGGVQVGRSEYVLKQNAKYSLTVTALSANPNNLCVSIDWYEHTAVVNE